jgi:hypothetical protein
VSNTRKWLIGIGIVGILCVIACGVMFLLLRQAGSQIAQSIKTDPTGVAQVGARIADFNLPPNYVQGAGASILIYDFVMYEPADHTPGTTIIMMQFKTGAAYSTQQMQQALERQSGQSSSTMKVVSTYQTTIRGHASTVVIEESTSNYQTGFVLRQLVTTFQGKGGMVMLMMSGSTDTWDQSLADKFIASIR